MKVDASLLETNELIAPLTRPEKDALMDLAIGRSYEAGETIFEEHDEAYSVIVLLKGRAGVQMDVGNGRQLMVATVEAGELTAWSGLVPPFQFTATGRAIEDCDVAIFKSEELRRLFDDDPRLGYIFMQRVACVIAERLRDTHLQLLGLFGS
jgi:CRP/FNR family cyclic AMP-dependent transcriptional regulator